MNMRDKLMMPRVGQKMNMIDRLGLMRNGEKLKDVYVGELLRAGSSGEEVAAEFRFAVVHTPTFTATASALPGLEYVQPTLTIRTIRIDLPFAKDDVLMLFGNRYTVQNVALDIREPQSGVTTFLITLAGGQPNAVQTE